MKSECPRSKSGAGGSAPSSELLRAGDGSRSVWLRLRAPDSLLLKGSFCGVGPPSLGSWGETSGSRSVSFVLVIRDNGLSDFDGCRDDERSYDASADEPAYPIADG